MLEELCLYFADVYLRLKKLAVISLLTASGKYLLGAGADSALRRQVYGVETKMFELIVVPLGLEKPSKRRIFYLVWRFSIRNEFLVKTHLSISLILILDYWGASYKLYNTVFHSLLVTKASRNTEMWEVFNIFFF